MQWFTEWKLLTVMCPTFCGVFEHSVVWSEILWCGQLGDRSRFGSMSSQPPELLGPADLTRSRAGEIQSSTCASLMAEPSYTRSLHTGDCSTLCFQNVWGPSFPRSPFGPGTTKGTARLVFFTWVETCHASHACACSIPLQHKQGLPAHPSQGRRQLRS